MYRQIEEFNSTLLAWAQSGKPWTNVYGLARTLFALSTALTLLVNDAQTFFRPISGIDVYPLCDNNISMFCLVPNDYVYLEMMRWLAIVMLFVIASGWRPRVTGVFHWWIAYSMNVSAVTLDGGEQVAAVLTFLMIPLTLTDSRTWHWQRQESGGWAERKIVSAIIAMVSLIAIRVQVAILYLHSTLAKLGEDTWIDGTAVYYFMQDSMLGLPEPLLKLTYPVITSPLVVIPTWGTLILQLSLFGALFAPKKYWKYFLILALLLHEVIAVMLGLISFSIIMIGALVLYLRPTEHEFTFYRKLLRKKRDETEGEIGTASFPQSRGA
ncbi:sporulation-delaying protein SdpB family protein [Mechercharimyces sp. CAU 1602]|uniref:sporulation-delaying protein SdpB family protein n=1 Tax=Mechercharimyces sp. CAU 1602 TaxID=2973933 RepID=UPI0021621342|nr:sporulation-delaying protein SdpB family protein [Mechercharimyces sp. CAU 1602]MCS1352295.1 hypothetical protein [Mechercharimyces sp. CAU 1602]